MTAGTDSDGAALAPGRLGAGSIAFARVAAIVVLVALLQHATAWSMVEAWTQRDTYAHGLFVVPVVLGWCWLRRATLAALPVRPAWPALALLGLLGGAAFVCEALALNAPGQFAVVAMVPAAIAAVLGTAWVRALAFPLAYLFFAVPAGDVLIPYLMDATADVVAIGLRVVGIPVFREADRLTIPSGHWLVAEACSGIRYLVACAAVGTVYAAATYRSPRRRIAFIAAMVLAAVVANWVRALAIVLLAHTTDNRLAVGVDHLVYGWVLFGVIVAAMFALGQRWREEPLPRPAPPPAPPTAHRPAALAALAAAALIGLAPLLMAGGEPSAAGTARLGTLRGAGGWEPADEPATAWRPRVRNAAAEHVETFERGGVRVGVYRVLFVGATREAKVYASNNQLVAADDPRWALVGRGVVRAPDGSELAAAAIAGDGTRLVAWQFYAVGGVVTASPVRAAWALALARLRGGPATSAWVTLVTPAGEADPLASPQLAAFWQAMRPRIAASLP